MCSGNYDHREGEVTKENIEKEDEKEEGQPEVGQGQVRVHWGLDTGAEGFQVKYPWLGAISQSGGKELGRTGVDILSAESRVQHLCTFPLGL